MTEQREAFVVSVITECLRVYSQHLQERAKKPKPLAAIEPVNFDQFERSMSVEGQVAAMLKDPVRSALKGRVRELGYLLLAEGGRGAMDRVAGQVEEAGGDGAVLDKWWDGISIEDKGTWVA
jgi:uncharacterized membrane-anchored protein